MLANLLHKHLPSILLSSHNQSLKLNAHWCLPAVTSQLQGSPEHHPPHLVVFRRCSKSNSTALIWSCFGSSHCYCTTFMAHNCFLLVVRYCSLSSLRLPWKKKKGRQPFAAYIDPSCARSDPVCSYCLLMCKLLHLTGSRFHSITLFKNLYFTHIVYKSLTKNYVNGLGHCEHRCWKFVLKTLVPCHTCDFVARLCRATLSRDKIARQNRRCDKALS